jgi:hypothetical protein
MRGISQEELKCFVKLFVRISDNFTHEEASRELEEMNAV